jgi:myo-inositol 2-dehydrogenase / D-chiro-inositol 1-dehydrogenase
VKLPGGLRDFLAGDTIRDPELGPGVALAGRRVAAPEPIRVAVIGCGNHSRGALQPNLARLPHFDYVAACDLDEGAAADCARRFGARAVFTDYERMLDEVKPEAAVVCGPPALHLEAGRAALDRGINLFVEKPPAPSAEDAEDLARRAADRGVIGRVGLFWRHSEAMARAYELARDPAFGRALLFDGEYLSPGPREAAWSWQSAAYTFLADQAIHSVDGMRFLMGEVTEVRARVSEGPRGAFGYAVTVGFESGATGALSVTSFTNAFTYRFAVHGDGGQSVVVEDAERVRLIGRPALGARGGYVDQSATEWRQGWSYAGHLRPGYVEELAEFAMAIRGGGSGLAATLDDAARDLRICEAILLSAETGEPVSLPRAG